MNCLALCMRVIRRIAKEVIHHDLCSKGMGISVKYRAYHTLIYAMGASVEKRTSYTSYLGRTASKAYGRHVR